MKFSIITPSYNMLDYLKLCHYSIMDQQDVDVEHIVIDGGSSDGTLEWLKGQKDIVWISEIDRGMYDAINKGLKIATGEILAYLNCDEQYLPFTLRKVKNFFERNRSIDLVFGHVLVINQKGELLSYRKAYRPDYNYIRSSILYNLSCAMFFRREITDKVFFFDDTLKDVADADFVLKLLKSGHKADYINEYMSVFTWTGKNMSIGENAKRERQILYERYGGNKILDKCVYNVLRYAEKFFSGAYLQSFPLKYEIFTMDSLYQRVSYKSKFATFKWPKKVSL